MYLAEFTEKKIKKKISKLSQIHYFRVLRLNLCDLLGTEVEIVDQQQQVRCASISTEPTEATTRVGGPSSLRAST